MQAFHVSFANQRMLIVKDRDTSVNIVCRQYIFNNQY